MTDHALQHPAVAAERSARNAVAAEMAIAGRARFHPNDVWIDEAHRSRWSDADATWVLASDDWATMREDLACAEGAHTDGAARPDAHAFAEDPGLPGTIDPSAGAHGAALASLAIPVGAAEGLARRARRRLRASTTAASALDHVPAARTRRERLELAFWFIVGGIGGLLLAAAVRVAEVVIAWT